MNKEAKIEMINEIVFTLKDSMERIAEIQTEVDGILYDTDIVNNYEAYGKYGFDQLLGNGNPCDDGLPSLIEHFESQLEELSEETEMDNTDFEWESDQQRMSRINKQNEGSGTMKKLPFSLANVSKR